MGEGLTVLRHSEPTVLTFVSAADPPLWQARDLRVRAHRPPVLRTSGRVKCTPGRLESAKYIVSMSDANTNPTVRI